MRLQRDSYAPKKCAFDAANVQFLRAHLCKSHPVLQHPRLKTRVSSWNFYELEALAQPESWGDVCKGCREEETALAA